MYVHPNYCTRLWFALLVVAWWYVAVQSKRVLYSFRGPQGSWKKVSCEEKLEILGWIGEEINMVMSLTVHNN
jgi:hypothetical protein